MPLQDPPCRKSMEMVSKDRKEPLYLHEGDIVYLSIDAEGYIHSDGFVDACLGCTKDISYLEGCLFRIIPKLSYDAQKTFTRMKVEENEKYALLAQQAKTEADSNATNISRLDHFGQPVLYGQGIQLQHVLSGKYLASRSKTLADIDKSCTKLELYATGSSKCWFTFVPRYRHRSMGHPILYSDAVCLALLKNHEMFLHLSTQATDSLCRQEVNLYYKATMIKIAPYTPRGHANLSLQAGKLYRLYHVEGQAFVTMSTNTHTSKPPYFRRLHPGTNPTDQVNMTVKSLFVLERLDPLKGGAIDLSFESVRFRHVATGRYLSVDLASTARITSNEPLTSSKKPTQHTCFNLEASRGDNQFVYRIEHRSHDRVHYLHNPNTPKMKSSSCTKSISSGIIQMTTELCDQDIYHLVPVSDVDSFDTRLILSTTWHLSQYRYDIQDALEKNVRISNFTVSKSLAALELLDEYFHPNHNELSSRQNKARDVKLIDALFEMLRVVDTNKLDLKEMALDPRRRVICRIHSVVNRILTRIVCKNGPNKHYIVTRTAAQHYNHEGNSTLTYLEEAMNNIGTETGSKIVMRALFEDHEALLTTAVNAQLINSSLHTLESKGIRAIGMLDFLATLCSCNGKSLPHNQELIVRTLFGLHESSSDTRLNTFIEISHCQSRDCQVPIAMKTMAMEMPQDMKIKGITMNPLGHSIIENGMLNIVISWKHCLDWAPGRPGLYHTPEILGLEYETNASTPSELQLYRDTLKVETFDYELNTPDTSISGIFDFFPTNSMPTKQANPRSRRLSRWTGSQAKLVELTTVSSHATVSKMSRSIGPKWILLEHVAWTLQPHDLYPLLFNEFLWDDANAIIRADPLKFERFERLKFLAEYFSHQLLLLVQLVRGGCSSSTKIVSQIFSYPLLLSAISNNTLPHVIRTSLGLILHFCYVEQFPHVSILNSSRIFVYENIQQLKNRTQHPLASFALKPAHPAIVLGMENGNEFMTYPHSNKMAVLQAALYILLSSFASRPIDLYTIQSSQFLSVLLDILHMLLQCGFYSDFDSQKKVVLILLSLLDGRHTGNEDARHRKSALNDTITLFKGKICQILSTFNSMWCDAEVNRVISFFKYCYMQEKRSMLLKKRTIRVSDVVQLLNDSKFNILEVSKGSLDFICIDLMMYDDKNLVHDAMALMIQSNTRREHVLKALMHCLLVHSTTPRAIVGGIKTPPSYQVLNELEDILPALKYRIMLVQSPASTMETMDLETILQELHKLIERLVTCCCEYSSDGLIVKHGRRKPSFWGELETQTTKRHHFPNYEKQRIVLHMNVHEIVLPLFCLNKAAFDPKLHDSITFIKNTSCEFITQLVSSHPSGQHAVFAHLGPLLSRFEEIPSMGSLLIATVSNNSSLCDELPEEALWKMMQLVNTHSARLDDDDPASAAGSFYIICQIFDFAIVYIAPNDIPSTKYQTILLDVFTHNQFKDVIPRFGNGIEPDMEVLSDALIETPGYQDLLKAIALEGMNYKLKYFQKTLVLMGLVCKGRNIACEVKCRQIYPLNFVFTVLLDAKMPLGLKYTCTKYLCQVFVHSDASTELTSLESPIWRVFMQSSNALRDYALNFGDRFLFREDDIQFTDLYMEYIYYGLLNVIATYFNCVIKPAAFTDVHVKTIIKDIRSACELLQERASMDSGQSKALHLCRLALGDANEKSSPNVSQMNQISPQNKRGHGILQPSQFDRFKLEISCDDAIQEILKEEFHMLLVRWESIDKESIKHSANVTLTSLCKKVIEFVEAHSASRCAVDALKILHKLCAKARVDDDTKRKMGQVELEEAMDRYSSMQKFLAECGAARLILTLIGSSTSTPTILLHAFALGSELLRGGNRFVQLIMYESLMESDGRFFTKVNKMLRSEIDRTKMERRLLKFLGDVRPEQYRRTSEVNVSTRPLDDEAQKKDIVSADVLIHFLTQLSTGHFHPMQSIMLDQSNLRHVKGHVNLLQSIVTLMDVLVKEDHLLPCLMRADVQTLAHSWECFVKFMQGPCEANQNFLIQSTMIDIFCKTLEISMENDQENGNGDLSAACLLKKLKANAVKAVYSLLEGRTTQDHVHIRLRSTLDVKSIRKRITEVYEEFEAEKDDHSDDKSWDEQFLEEGVQLFVIATIVYGTDSSSPFAPPSKANTSKCPVKRSDFSTQQAFQNGIEKWLKEQSSVQAYRFFSEMICTIELWWGHPEPRLEKIYFARPSHCTMFQCLGARKERFMQKINYKSKDRLRQFAKEAAQLNEEMLLIETLSQFSLYNFLRPHIPLFKQASFLLAIFINLIVLVAVSKDEAHMVFTYDPFSVLDIMDWLGRAQIFLSFCVFFFILVVWIPLTIKRRYNAMIKQTMVEAKLLRDQKRASKNTLLDLEEIKDLMHEKFDKFQEWWLELYQTYLPFIKLSILVCLVVLVFVQGKNVIPLWVPFALLIIPFVINTRSYLNNSSSFAAFIFTTLYDIVFDKYTSFYIVYMAISVSANIMGLPMLFGYHLLDIVIVSPTLQNVVMSVVKPRRVLILTTLLGLYGLYVFSMLLFFFQPNDARDDKKNVEYCRTLLDCFMVFVSQGLPFGGGMGRMMSEDLNHPPPLFKRREYWIRILYDVVVFAFSAIMLNMIFGITIDTFSNLRTESNEREMHKRNQCFVCGLSRGTFDNHYNQHGIPQGFQKHVNEEHNMWHYLFFITHINSKETINCTGPEAFVKASLIKDDFTWFPQSKSTTLSDIIRYSEEDDIRAIKAQLKSLDIQSKKVVDFIKTKHPKKSRAFLGTISA